MHLQIPKWALSAKQTLQNNTFIYTYLHIITTKGQLWRKEENWVENLSPKGRQSLQKKDFCVTIFGFGLLMKFREGMRCELEFLSIFRTSISVSLIDHVIIVFDLRGSAVLSC